MDVEPSDDNGDLDLSNLPKNTRIMAEQLIQDAKARGDMAPDADEAPDLGGSDSSDGEAEEPRLVPGAFTSGTTFGGPSDGPPKQMPYVPRMETIT